MRTILLLFILTLTQVAYPQDFIPAPVNPFGIMRTPGPFVFADVDGDNDQDVLITTSRYEAPSGQVIPGRAGIYANDGAGKFSYFTNLPSFFATVSSIAFSDVDGDNDQDLLITGTVTSSLFNFVFPVTKLYTNDGTGIFSEVTNTSFEGLKEGSIAFSDVDGDNDQDVLLTGRDSSEVPIARLYINDGTGTFSKVTGTPFEGVSSSSVAFADVDGDNDQDVLITGQDSSEITTAKLYANNGAGTFSEVSGTPFEGVSSGSIAFADVDGDDDQDVLITGYSGGLSGTGTAKLYINDGMGIFSEAAGTSFEGVVRSSVAFTDVDGDNDQDVLITGLNSGGISKLYINDGTGTFSEVTPSPFEGVPAFSMALADVDGDNDGDVILSGIDINITILGVYDLHFYAKLYTNDGTGAFSDKTGAPILGGADVAFADVDGDDDQDLIVTGTYFSRPVSRLYTNDGKGTYCLVSGFQGVSASSIAFADVDGDDDQDVFITGENNWGNGISILYANDGTGTFSQVAGTPFEEVSDGSIAFVDVDGDDDQDVLITGENNSGTRISKLYANDGTGTFSEVAGTPFEGVSSSSIAFEDVDGDNDKDVLLTGENNSGAGISKLYTNDGAGTFSEVAGTPFEGVSSSSIAFADVDEDNDQDVLITGENNSGTGISKLYTNDGRGTFSEVTGTPFEWVSSSSVAFADVDGDDDPDVLIKGENSSGDGISKLYVNDGTGAFSEVAGTPFNWGAGSIAFADVDGDDDQDVLISNRLYLNTTMIVSDSDVQAYNNEVGIIYPNPSLTGVVSIDYIASQYDKLAVNVFDLTGKLMLKGSAEVINGQNTLQLDIGDLNPGAYFIQLSNEINITTLKLIVQ